jgi:predicted small lipoprotein YifL
MLPRVSAAALGALLATLAACGLVAPGPLDASGDPDASPFDTGRLHAVFDATGYQQERDIRP